MLEYGLDFGREDQNFIDDRVIKRIDAELISGQHQLLLFLVVERECKLAVEFVDEIYAVFFVEVDENFDVAASAKRVSFFDQAASQLAVVIDLAIANDHDGFVFIEEWLVAAFQIDDAQSAKAEADIVFDKVARRVRASMDELVRHLHQKIAVYLALFA